MSSAVKDALLRRRSVRGFQPTSIPEAVMCELFETAQLAPSWCNTQPWKAIVTAGDETLRIRQALVRAAKAGTVPTPDIAFPPQYDEPHKTRRRECGVALYSAMGVARDDSAGRLGAWLRNYEFFDAPHLAVVSRPRSLGEYATLDVGVWLGVLLTVASSMGIDSCAMASTAAYPQVLRDELGIQDSEVILFGIALGYEDPAVLANQCRTTREPAASNLQLLGF